MNEAVHGDHVCDPYFISNVSSIVVYDILYRELTLKRRTNASFATFFSHLD
jgi:hypothetical protein